MIKRIFNYFHILQNIYIKNKFFIKRVTYSQDKEDLKVLKFFKNKKKGFYVDVGCFHPIKINNTYLLYKKNWRGINIDTSKFSIELFNYLRPDDLNFNCAVSNKDKKISFYYQKDHSVLNSINKSTAAFHIKGKLKKKTLKGLKLDTIINKTKYKYQQIDFLDIDVEGADLKVLEGLSLKKYKPKLICIEIYDQKVKDSKVYKYLIKFKYKLIWSGRFSHIFKLI